MCYLSNICSLCLIPNQNLKSILSEDSDGTVVEEKLKIFLLELIQFKPNIQKYICNNCLVYLNCIHKFRQRCLENITILNKYLHNLEVQGPYINLPETLSGTKYVEKYSPELQNQNNNETCIKENDTHQMYPQAIVNIKSEFDGYVFHENTNFMEENSERNVPNDIATIKIEETHQSTLDNNIVKQEHGNVLFQTPYESFSEFNEEKYINENMPSSNNIAKVHPYGKSGDIVEPYVNTKIKVEDFISEAETFEERESDDEYLPSNASSSTASEGDNSDIEVTPMQTPVTSKIKQSKGSNWKAPNYATGEKEFVNIYDKMNPKHEPLLPKNIYTDMLQHETANNSENIPSSAVGEESTNRPHKCRWCSKAYTFKCKLIIHERTHNGDRPYKCDLCAKTFTENGALKVHKKKHSDIKPFHCDVCGKSFSLNSFLLKHKRTHTNEKPHKCEFCDKAFNRLDYLIEHKRTHTGNKPYACDLCEKSFNRASNLTEHKRIHTGEKPYKCEVCAKDFSQKCNLIKHKRTHTGEKPYECDVCKKSFTEGSSLRVHKRIHTGQKSFQCDLCERAFYQAGHLVRHKLTMHSGGKTFECTMCPYKCRTNANLEIHVHRKHSSENSTPKQMT